MIIDQSVYLFQFQLSSPHLYAFLNELFNGHCYYFTVMCRLSKKAIKQV
jgi:hypothetical protein